MIVNHAIVISKHYCNFLNYHQTQIKPNNSFKFCFQFRSNLYHLVLNQCSEEAKERINNSSYQYVDCVEQILKATKILTYS